MGCRHDADRMLALRAIFPDKASLAKLASWMGALTKANIAAKSWKYPDSRVHTSTLFTTLSTPSLSSGFVTRWLVHLYSYLQFTTKHLCSSAFLPRLRRTRTVCSLSMSYTTCLPPWYVLDSVVIVSSVNHSYHSSRLWFSISH